MKSKIQAFAWMLVGGVFFMDSVPAQNPSLNDVLRRSVSERIGGPLVFSTRDTLFALSLPTDEPATVYLQLTIGRNGKVKEKQTKVHANHVAQYVAPAFVEATKELRVDRALLSGLGKKDTAVLVAFPMEYVCAYDTINKAWPGMEPKPVLISNLLYKSSLDGSNDVETFQRQIKSDVIPTAQHARWIYQRTLPTRVWYYLAFIKNQEE